MDHDAQQVRHVLAALLQAPRDDITLHVVHPCTAFGKLVGVRRRVERAPAQPGGDDLDSAAALPALRECERECRGSACARVDADHDGATLVSHGVRVAAPRSGRIRPSARIRGTFVPPVPDRRPCRDRGPMLTLDAWAGRTSSCDDVAWPVATGLVTGPGLFAAYRRTGPPMFLVAFAVLEVTVAPVAWSLLTEVGFDVRRIALRVAPVVAATPLAVIGLADSIGGWTFLVVATRRPRLTLFQGGAMPGFAASWPTGCRHARRRGGVSTRSWRRARHA